MLAGVCRYSRDKDARDSVDALSKYFAELVRPITAPPCRACRVPLDVGLTRGCACWLFCCCQVSIEEQYGARLTALAMNSPLPKEDS